MRSIKAASGMSGREHAVDVKRFSYTFEFLEPEVLKVKSSRYEAPRRFRDEYRIGSGKGL